MWDLFYGRSGSGVVGVYFRRGGWAQGPSLLGHCVVDVGADEICDVGVVEGVPEEGVGKAVLHGAQVDMRQRSLGHGGHDASNARELVGQGLIDYDVSRAGTIVRFHEPQQAVPFPRVQGNEIAFAEDVFVEQEVDSGLPVRRQVRLVVWKRVVCYVVGQVVVKQRHVCSHQGVNECHMTEGLMMIISTIARPVPPAACRVPVESLSAIGGNEFRVISDLTRNHTRGIRMRVQEVTQEF